MVVYDKTCSVVQDSRMRSLCNMVVLYGDRIIIKSTMHSAARVRYEEVQDFRCSATWLLYGDRITRSSMQCKILVYVSLCNNMVAVRCSHLKISSTCEILEYISIVQHCCYTVLVSQNL